MAYLQHERVGIRATGTTVAVPNDPKAKLMYYLQSMCSVLQLNDDRDIMRLSRYENYRKLDRSDVDLLISLCILLSPEDLTNKCIFHDVVLCGDSGNEFYELETVRNNLLVAENIMIAGQNRRVAKIMTFKMGWLRDFYFIPMKILLERQRESRAALARRKQRSGTCNIL